MRTTRWLLTTSALAAIGLWAVGCQGDGSTSPPPGGGGAVTIGPAGGTVTSADGNFTITIPAGALDAATAVTVTKVDVAAAIRIAASTAPSPVSSTGGSPAAAKLGPSTPRAAEMLYVTGSGYDVKPSDLQLHKPASVKIKYDPNNVPGECDSDQLRIRYRERAQNRWMDSEHVGSHDNSVEGNASVFTTFAIFGPALPVASVVNVSPATLDLEEGDVVQLSAEVLDADGAALDVPVTWSVDDPAIATVDASGQLTALVDGTTSVTATAGGKQGSSGVTVNKRVGSVDITALPDELVEGQSARLVADVRDGNGNAINNPMVTWTSLTPTIATVDASGTVTGLVAGDATIVAQSRKKADTVSVTVFPSVASITISGTAQQALMVGATRQLTATAYNAAGQPVSTRIRWASSSTSIATVDDNGLVTGVARGTATITASTSQASASASVRVAGESGEEETGNNLSVPVVFAEGVGLTGVPVAEDAGLNVATVTRPFFSSSNASDCSLGGTNYFCQGGSNLWQAEWIDGSGSPRQAEVAWGDNMTHHTFDTHQPIHVEITMSDIDAGLMRGFNMTVISGSGSTQVMGTDGTMGDFVPLIYTQAARLIIEKLDDDDTTRAPIVTTFDKGLWQKEDGPGQFAAEVTGAGKVAYGYQLKVQDIDAAIFGGAHKYGFWRLSFVMGGNGGPQGNALMRRVAQPTDTEEEPPQYMPVVSTDGMRSSLTIYIAKGGTGGGEH